MLFAIAAQLLSVVRVGVSVLKDGILRGFGIWIVRIGLRIYEYACFIFSFNHGYVKLSIDFRYGNSIEGACYIA